ncbi:hypothetical protein Poli38472_006056 [Pythium oligandrum]|uniref:Rab-GAP TBC domain-containing protein n=1 Tax=Pythium oligandrum TaxID=41045 RepID=A0A8K1CUP0_PYTOL|nr:hypothetical protein Poli38472_006056 [Pythium oligandrum]|eukprot:TMW68588.1 hypothetical protein Poli38472_006056 [Pythium oligandrum]
MSPATEVVVKDVQVVEMEFDDEDVADKSWRFKEDYFRTSRWAPEKTGPKQYKRHEFWRSVIEKAAFLTEAEHYQVMSLTGGIHWMDMMRLPRQFMERHQAIYHLIATADYEWSDRIQRDVTRTFSIFESCPTPSQDVASQQRALFRVLNAVAEAEDGYCQGMNFIAALFLVEGLEEADTYALFIYLLKKRQLARIYQHSSTFLDDYLQHFESMFKEQLPELHHHVHGQGFVAPMYAVEWFTTLFSLSTKVELSCAVFDLFFVGVQDIFLRTGLAIFKLLEAKLMDMNFEDFLRDFKSLVKELDPLETICEALRFKTNPAVRGEDTTAFVSRTHIVQTARETAANGHTSPPKSFSLHRSLSPELKEAIKIGDYAAVSRTWRELTSSRSAPALAKGLANEILHHAVWYGQVAIASFAIKQCNANVDDRDDTNLTPLHFSVLRNQPDLVRLLLCSGADENSRGGRWSGSVYGLTPLETAKHWTLNDTTAVRLVLERQVCLCCNTRFDPLVFSKVTCEHCQFPYCRRPHAMCIEYHQCPANATRRYAYYDDSMDTTSYLTSSTCALSESDMSSRASSRSHSLSKSDSTSSFVYITSPAMDLSTDTDSISSVDGGRFSLSERPSEALLDSLSDMFGYVKVVNQDDGEVEQLSSSLKRTGIEFPDRPEWYCNGTDCHKVFAFFTTALECRRCGGFYCTSDYNAATKLCRNCTEAS